MVQKDGKKLRHFSTSRFLGFAEGAAHVGKWKSWPSEHRQHGELVTVSVESPLA